MILDTHTKSVLSSSIENLAKKQQVIASNIANIDTPNYKSKTTNFDVMMDKMLLKESHGYEKNFMQTHQKHFNLKGEFSKQNSQFEVLQKNNYLYQNDENDVDLDIENVEMSKSNILMNAAMGAWKKETNNFKKVLDTFGKLN